MTTPPASFDMATYPTKETILLLTSLLEKVTLANDMAYSMEGSVSVSEGASDGHGETVAGTTNTTSSTPHGRTRGLSYSSTYTCFHARSIPSISIHAYLVRILKYCPCANECFLALLVYFDRMSKPTSSHVAPLRLDSFNVHRLVITGIMIASKLFSDVFFTNSRYAKVNPSLSSSVFASSSLDRV
ncbi:cyclin-domain-containing protein, partial [Spinellus fusiger]